MRLKITHKDGDTTVTNAETGKVIGGVVAVSFERRSIDHPATVTMTLVDAMGDAFEFDAEVRLPSKEGPDYPKGDFEIRYEPPAPD